MKSKRLKTLIFTGFSAFYSFLSVKLGIIAYMTNKGKHFFKCLPLL